MLAERVSNSMRRTNKVNAASGSWDKGMEDKRMTTGKHSFVPIPLSFLALLLAGKCRKSFSFSYPHLPASRPNPGDSRRPERGRVKSCRNRATAASPMERAGCPRPQEVTLFTFPPCSRCLPAAVKRVARRFSHPNTILDQDNCQHTEENREQTTP